MFCQISDEEKTIIAQVPLKTKKGYQQISWDLRHQIILENGKLRTGPFVKPGSYQSKIVVQKDVKKYIHV